MNWSEFMSKIFGLIPYVVVGINTVHAEKDTATKTQMAHDALSVATAGAQQVLSGSNAQAAQAASAAVSAVIQATQAIHDAAKG